MFRAIKIKVTGEETEINQEKDYEFSDYERELGAVETLNNFPAIYNGKTAMIMTNRLNDDKSIPINDKASSYYQKFLDTPETKSIKDNIPSFNELKISSAAMRGLYVRGDCILVLQSGGTHA
tara:strand:- start:15 stop:380 length:366 start_codon:yes stop_codon:yes gene_type:complete